MDMTRFEKARIIGARALQVSMGAGPLIKGVEPGADPVRIALKEFDKGLVPISVKRDN